MLVSFLCSFSFAGLALAQSQGIPAEWDVRRSMSQLTADVQGLKPILDQVSPQGWLEKEAPEAYIVQHRSTQAQVGYLIRSVEQLSNDPECSQPTSSSLHTSPLN